jgi:hypothetical protein
VAFVQRADITPEKPEGAAQHVVGWCTLTPPDPQLKGAWFQTRTLEHQSWFHNVPFKCNLRRYNVALFKNVLVAADGGKSARLHVYDVRDWSVKQVIRVGEVSEAITGDSSGSGGPAPASVSVLAFDGMTIAAGTHQGYVHTWKLMGRVDTIGCLIGYMGYTGCHQLNVLGVRLATWTHTGCHQLNVL